jgi:hypothetical protein
VTHADQHPLAGQTVTVNTLLPVHGRSDNSFEYRIEDRQDRVFGQSWMYAEGNPAALLYAMRSGFSNLPLDNEVLYGKDPSGMGHIVHVSEIAVEGDLS